MAQGINFHIGSTFSGEGFKAAQESVSNVNKGVRSAAQAASGMSAALGGIDSSAARAMGAITGMMNSLMTLNATAIITQAAMLAITAYINHCNKEMEELKERTDALKASVDRSFNAALTGTLSELAKEIKGISGDFDRVTQQAAAFSAALLGLKGSVATGGIINLEIEKVNAMLEAHSAEEKATIEATYNLKIATEKAAASREQWTGRVDAAHKELVAAEERVSLYDQEIAAVQAKRAQLEEVHLQLKQNNSEKADRVAAELAKLAEQEASLRQAQNDTRARAQVLAIQEQKAIQDATNAAAQQTLEMTKAEAKLSDLTASHEALAEKEAEAARQQAENNRLAKEKADRLAEEKALSEQARDAQKKVNESARDLAEAERAYAEALAAYERNFGQNKMLESIMGENNGMRNGMAIPVRVEGAIKGEVVAHDVEAAIKNGLVLSVKDMDKFARARAREVDKFERDKLRQLERERQRYNTLRERNRKTWSKADTEFAQKFEKLKEAAEAQKKEIEAAQKRLEEEQRRARENHDNLKNIKTKLDALGLK